MGSEAEQDATRRRVFQCTIPGCSRTYHRSEHLLRHTRSHTLQKPYDCPKCLKSYSRQDVLKRHITQQHETSRDQGKARRHMSSTGRPIPQTLDILRTAVPRSGGQSPQPLQPALSPSPCQNEESADWQWEDTQTHETESSSSIHGSGMILGVQPPSFRPTEVQDLDSCLPLSMSSANLTLPTQVDSFSTWASYFDPSLSFSHAMGPIRPRDTPSTTGNVSLNQNQANTTANRLHASSAPSTSRPGPGLPHTKVNIPIDTISHLLHASDSATCTQLDALKWPEEPTGVADQAPPTVTPHVRTESIEYQKCLNLYFEVFHPRWPVVHRGTFDATVAGLDLISSMILIGAWESGIPSWMQIAERWSEWLVNRLNKNLAESASCAKPEANCTLQAYQALLLNVIFTLQYSDDMRFSKAYIRYCTMMAIFRNANLFEEQYKLAQDDPLDTIPTSWLNREMFKRLAFFSFRLDIYFVFLRGFNPIMRYEELYLTTPSSERLWEADTAEEWHKIKRIDSEKRTGLIFVTLVDIAMDCEGRDTLPALFEDDYVYGLCAMQAWLWSDINKRRSSLELSQARETPRIRSHLESSRVVDYWAMLLSTWKDCYRGRAVGSLLSSQKHRAIVENSAMSLYHLSQISLRANLKAIKSLATDRCHRRYPGTHIRQLDARILEWVKTPDSRLAMWHASQVLKLFHQSSTGQIPTSYQGDFIASVALYEAGLVAWAYTRSIRACDDCSAGSILQRTSTAGIDAFELFGSQDEELFGQWVNKGGREQIRGIIVCACKLEDIVQLYESFLLCHNFQSHSISGMARLLSELKHQD